MAQDLLILCAACQHEFRAQDRLAGKTVPCPYCRRPVTLAASVSAEAEDKLVGQVIGGCRLIRRLGAGAMGVVYEAEQVAMKRRVAMKMLTRKAAANPNLVSRFQREAHICAQIKHPHVIGVHDCGFERGVHYLTMEMVDGCTMSSLVDEMGKLPWREASQLIAQVAEALNHVAELKIIHRDVKPANILLTNDRQAKLADLGLAKQTEGGTAGGEALTMQGAFLGSPAYMAPEQVRNARDVTHAADVYSLGATFYHALCGSPPFEGKNASDVITKVLREHPRPVHEVEPSVPAGISALVHQMLAKNPYDRPQNAGEFLTTLNTVMSAPTKPPLRSMPRRRRASEAQAPNRGLTVGLIFAAAAVAAVIAWFLLR